VKPDLPRPPSAVSSSTGWWGVAAIGIGLVAIKLGQFPMAVSVPLMLLLPAVAMLAWEISVVHPWRAPDAQVNRELLICVAPDRGRVARKLLGFAAVFIGLSVWFAMVPHYKSNYADVFRSLLYTAPLWLSAGIAYIIWIDPRMPHPHDGAWHLGQLLTQRLSLRFMPKELPITGKPLKQARWKEAGAFVQTWFIKGFFLIFLLQLLPGNIAQLQRESFDPWNSLFRLVFVLTPLLFTIDIVLAAIGYVCTFKLLNAHIRSPSPLWHGWVSALICYPPFVIIGGFAATDYRVGGTYWDLWLSNPWAKWIWAMSVLICLFTYVWATVAFGIRFSNLTNRGTITHGPYRLLKHPAYISKNLYWWLIYVPWVNQLGRSKAMLACALLLVLAAIYWLRAKTEEAHLSKDPEYRAYLSWFNSHTLWQRIKAK
jgi:hypothetical protein